MILHLSANPFITDMSTPVVDGDQLFSELKTI